MLLRRRLMGTTPEEMKQITIVIDVSPQTLIKGSRWLDFFDQLSRCGNISFVCLDEAHTVHQCGRNFDPAFLEAVTNLGSIMRVSPLPVPRIAMSPTLRECDRDTISRLFHGGKAPTITRGSLGRRGTNFLLKTPGYEASSIKSSTEHDLVEDKGGQSLIYTNSKTNCEGPLLVM